jgi:hypothetical protein
MNILYSSLIAWVKSGINLITVIKDANGWGIHSDLLEVSAYVLRRKKSSYFWEEYSLITCPFCDHTCAVQALRKQKYTTFQPQVDIKYIVP